MIEEEYNEVTEENIRLKLYNSVLKREVELLKDKLYYAEKKCACYINNIKYSQREERK